MEACQSAPAAHTRREGSINDDGGELPTRRGGSQSSPASVLRSPHLPIGTCQPSRHCIRVSPLQTVSSPVHRPKRVGLTMALHARGVRRPMICSARICEDYRESDDPESPGPPPPACRRQEVTPGVDYVPAKVPFSHLISSHLIRSRGSVRFLPADTFERPASG